MFNPTLRKAIKICFEKRIPFAAFCKPMAGEVTFFSDPMYNNISNRLEGDKFVVNFYNSDDTVTINAVYDAAQTIEHCWNIHPLREPEISPWLISTEYLQYVSQVYQIVGELKSRGGKVVLSKVVCGKDDTIDWVDVADNYFKMFPDTLRYLYYTPETGCWLGVSPEILLRHRAGENFFETMSLAGTRLKTDDATEWDAKNKEEHDYVTQYICEVVNRQGFETEVMPDENLPFGEVEHLCNRIKAIGKTTDNALPEVAAKLSPTPAFAGYPMGAALVGIMRYEVHSRYCYSGYVAVENKEGFDAYVNMRCVHFDERNYCMYAGGGLTSKSKAADEWAETEHKISPLKSLIIHNP